MIDGHSGQQFIDTIQVDNFFESFKQPTAEPAFPPFDFDGLSLDRRMSMSATSDSTSSKRLLTPDDESPQPAKRLRPAASFDDGSYPGSDTDSFDQAKVQLPSIVHAFGDNFRHDPTRRMSLPTDALGPMRFKSEDGVSAPRTGYPASPLSNYQFPPMADNGADGSARPRVDTQVALGSYATHSPYPATATTPATASSYYGPSPLSPESSSALGAPLSTHHLFNGATRIAGQPDRRLSLATSSSTSDGQVKSEWTFPSTEFTVTVPPADSHQSYSPNGPGAISLPPPAASPSSNPSRSPDQQHAVPPPMPAQRSLVESAPRKRGKLPKHVTDYLKEWLHRHADHPYPSEDEKKQLCHTTGLSMSQVSNWMINARRRILAPAQRAAAAAAASGNPYGGRSASHTAQLLEAGRRASMPGSTVADGMSLYHPSHLGGISPYGHTGSEYFGQGHRSILSMPRSAYSVDPTYASHRLAYPQSLGGTHYLTSGVPMSAPPTLSSASLAGGHGAYSSSVYAQSAYTRDSAPRGGYYQPSGTPTPASGSSQTGSNYGTPQ